MSIEDRIRTLEEIEAVRRVLAAVGATCDAPYDGAAFAGHFSEDGVMDLMEMGVYTGRAAIQEFIDGMRARVPFTMHYWDGYAIDIDGDEATATWYGFETPNLNGTAHLGGLTLDGHPSRPGAALHDALRQGLGPAAGGGPDGLNGRERVEPCRPSAPSSSVSSALRTSPPSASSSTPTPS